MATAVTDRGPADESKASEKTPAKVDAFLRKVVKKFNRTEASESANRQKALDDLRFKAGDQWPEDIKATRTIEKRPCLTINKMKTFVHQITNDQRQNRPAINISPVGDKGDPETAKMLKGLIRQIERQSNADIAYDTGFDSAVSGGWGYWRIITEYEDDDSFNQVARIKRIRNPFRVYLDPDSQEPDGSDAQFGFITDLIPRDEYDETYGKSSAPEPWTEGSMGDEYKIWSTQTHVRIAEYFCFETKVRKLLALRNGHVGFEDELDASLKSSPRKNEREVRVKTIKWYKLTCKKILDESDWPGKWIPIVKVIGDEVDIEGKVTLAGIVRDAKDAQRMYNFWVTSETELIALAPKAPWVMEEGQIEGHEKRWQQANNKSLPYLLYKGTSISGRPAPPPQRQQFAGPPAGVVQAKISAAQDMQATTGIRFDATLQERTYDESGKALRELKRVGDVGNFHYVDNLARSLRHTGEILIDIIQKIYDTPRVLTILREDDSEERIKVDPTLGRSGGKEQLPDGRMQRLFNPKLGDYGVVVTIGPSFATKRAEAADSMINFVKAVPQAGQVAGDLIAKNMDWPGADEIAARLMSMLPPHMVDKKLDQLPPEARGQIMQLMQQLQQLKQERDQAVSMLGDKEKDRDIDRQALVNESEKIRRDYDAKMAKIVEDLQKEILKISSQAAEKDTSKIDAAKIEADLLKAVMKIIADREAKMLELELKTRESAANMDLKSKEMDKKAELQESAQKDKKDNDQATRADAQKGLRRTGDIEKLTEKFDKIQDKLQEQIKELKAELKGMGEVEIHFDRDPSTKRITKARRVKPEKRVN